MQLAVTFRETLHGTWYRLAAPEDELPASLRLDNQVPLWKLTATGRASFAGRLVLDGHASDVIVRGEIRVDGRTKSIGYLFDYVADDGAPHRFVGQKDILPIHLPDGLLELSATLYRQGRDPRNELGRVRLRTASPSPFLRMLKSLRVGSV